VSRKLLFGSLLLGAGALALVVGLSEPKLVYAKTGAAFVANP